MYRSARRTAANGIRAIRDVKNQGGEIRQLERQKVAIGDGYRLLLKGADVRTGLPTSDEDRFERENAKRWLALDAAIRRLGEALANANHRRTQMESEHPHLGKFGLQLDAEVSV
jgi:hypothetical protein